MDDRKKLQREVMNGPDGLEQLVQREQSLQTLDAATSPGKDTDRDEVLKLKTQMEELHQRFIGLCARIEERETANHQPSRAEVVLASQALRQPGSTPIRSFPPSLEEQMVRMSQLREAKKARLWLGVTLLALMAGGVAVWLRYKPVNFGAGQVVVQSEPAEADVYIDNQFRGQTPLQLKSIGAGNYRVRITKEGYEPLLQEVHLSQGETARVEVRLNELSAADLQTLARSLFNQGKLREADRICTLLFRKPPYDAFALDLKQKILSGLLAEINPEGLPRKTNSTEPASQQAGQSALETSEPSEGTPRPPGRSVKNEIANDDHIHQISQTSSSRAQQVVPVQRPIQTRAMSSEKSSGASEMVSPVLTDQTVRHELHPIDTEILERIKNQIQSKNFVEARALLQHLPEASPRVVELKSLIELAETDVQKQKTLVSSALQKAESALIVGHYVTPPDDNVVLHCNRGISLDPQNHRLLALKKEVIQRSIAQARDWIQRGKFEQARASYSSLNYLSQNDPGFPVQSQWFQEELNKLEFTSYPVIHEHKFGSCSGRLRMNAHVLSFVPSGDSSHGFTEPLRALVVTEAEETIKVRLDGKNYEFRPNSNQESASSRQAFQAVYEQLMNLVAKATN